MNEAIPLINSLVCDIIGAIPPDNDLYFKMYSILSRFQRFPHDPFSTLLKLKNVLCDYPNICHDIDCIVSQFPLCSDIPDKFAFFIEKLNQISENHILGNIISDAISFYSEELIDLKFLCYYVSKFVHFVEPEMQKKVCIWTEGMALQVKIHKVKQMGLCVGDKTFLGELPDTINLEPMFCVPIHIRFLAMVNLLIPSEEDIACIVKCIKLYGSNVIGDEEAIEWISEFDKHLADKFKEIILENDPSSFLPANLKSIINKDISPQLQLWAIGPTLLKEINKSISTQQTKTNSKKKKPKTTSKSYHIIGFLKNRIDLFYQELVKIQDAVINFKQPEFSSAVINALYGKQVKNPNGEPISAQIIMNHCYNFGRETIENFMIFILDSMNSSTNSSIEWRNFYNELLRPQFIKKMLVFQGYQGESPRIPNFIRELLKSFLLKFNKISECFIDNFMKIFEQKRIYLKESGILCFYYFLTILRAFNKSNEYNENDPEILINLIFEENEVPFKQYNSPLLANIDIPMKYFAKFAYKSEKEGLYYEDSTSLLSDCDSPFFFEIAIVNDNITINSSMNICIH